MRIKKISETTPTMASIVNGYSTSTQDGYSCEYINNSENYSTSEVKTNKRWIDGKPIYRKVVKKDNPSGAGNVATGIINFDTLVSLSGMFKREAYSYSLPAPHYSNNAYAFSTHISNNGQSIEYEVGSSLSNVEFAYFYVEYTKTTDIANINSQTRNLQESKKSVSEDDPIDEPVEDIEPSNER